MRCDFRSYSGAFGRTIWAMRIMAAHMLSALLYFATALALLAIVRRYVTRFTRAAAIALLLLPLTFTGRALLTGRLLAPVDIPYLTEPFYGMRAAHGVGEPYDRMLSDI